MPDTASLNGWHSRLIKKAENEDLTMNEGMFLCLLNIMNHTYTQAKQGEQTMQAAQHTEGMLGAIDEMFSRHDPHYAGSGAVRAALDAKRDADRQIAEEQRRKALTSQEDAA